MYFKRGKFPPEILGIFMLIRKLSEFTIILLWELIKVNDNGVLCFHNTDY